MKRLSMVLAPALMTGALLGLGAAAEAQSNLVTIGSTSPIGKDAVRGTQFTLQFSVTPANSGANMTRSLFGFAYDPNFIEVVGNWTLNTDILNEGTAPSANLRVQATRTVASGDMTGRVFRFDSQIYGWTPGTGGPILNGQALVATLNVRLKANAPGGFADFGIGFTDTGDGLFQANQTGTVFNNQRTGVNTLLNDVTTGTTDAAGGNFDLHGLPARDGGFRVGVVPGPSSLAIFALGGLTPVMGLIRRRRAAK